MFSGGKNKPVAKVRARAGGPGELSFLGADVAVTGDLATGGQIHIDGKVDGDVRCDMLVQGEGGIIAGNIVADSVHLSGLVEGAVTARLVTLDASARVTGDVSYETLSIAAGAAIEGRLSRKDCGPTAEPEVRAVIAQPAAEKKRARLARPDTPGLLPHLDAPATAAPAR